MKKRKSNKNISRKIRGNKGQVWTTDFIIGVVLFILTLILGIRIILDIYSPSEYNNVYRDAVHLSDAVLSQGYPFNWSTSNVILPGVAENNRINNTQLQEFKNLDYYYAKSLLHIDSDFIFFIRNNTATIRTGLGNSTQCIYGYNLTVDANCTPTLPSQKDNLVKIERTVIYNSKIVIMTFYVWN